MVTCAPPAGWASSSVVTHTSEFSSPHLKWTDRFVTSAVVGTYIGWSLPCNAAPRCGLDSSTMYRPGAPSGIPTTSNAFAPFGFGKVNDFTGNAGKAVGCAPGVALLGGLSGLKTDALRRARFTLRSHGMITSKR